MTWEYKRKGLGRRAAVCRARAAMLHRATAAAIAAAHNMCGISGFSFPDAYRKFLA